MQRNMFPKKIITCLIGLVFIFFITGFLSAGGWDSYVKPAYGISFDFPGEWFIEDDDYGGQFMVTLSTIEDFGDGDEEGAILSINAMGLEFFYMEETGEELTLENIWQEFEKSMQEEEGDVEMEEADYAILSGFDCIHVVARSYDEDVYAELYLVLAFDKLYMISIGCQPMELEYEYRPLLQEILNTLEIFEPEEAMG